MRISRIYLAQNLVSGDTITLQGETAHYLSKVLRLKPGDSFNPFNETDGEFSAAITSLARNQLTVMINSPVVNTANPQIIVNLGLGLSRGERMDYGIQKATELGVSSITPLITARGEVKLSQDRQINRLQHWQKVAISASEQCGRTSVPTITTPNTLTSWVQENNSGIVLDHRGMGTFAEQTFKDQINLVVGAEGGLSDHELEIAQQNQYAVIKLGPRILRTETAPIVALSVLQYLFGDF